MTRRAVAAIAIINTSPSYIIAAWDHAGVDQDNDGGAHHIMVSGNIVEFAQYFAIAFVTFVATTNLSNDHRLSCSEESQQYEVYGETPTKFRMS